MHLPLVSHHLAMSGPGAPAWLTELLSPSTIPTLPLPKASHDKPAHPSLTAQISDAQYHPALEAALHLANGDLYSAHFLVRKSQGGAKELDWGHAILHRLEGDMGNAKVRACGRASQLRVTRQFLTRPPLLLPRSAGTRI